jgi:hypothetical protein
VRRLAPLLAAIAAFAAIGVLWIVTDRRASERVYDDFSSANTSDAGLSQASAYLSRRGSVAMLTRPVGRDPMPRNAVVFRVAEEVPVLFDPEELGDEEYGPPKPKEPQLLSAGEETFVRGGGRIVLAAQTGLLPDADTGETAAEKVFPIWKGIDALASKKDARGFTALRPRMHALFVAGDRVVVARERIGAGDLVVISWPHVFQNEHLGKANHLALLAALAGRRPVYFDEVPHGIVSGDGALAIMKDWNLGPFLLMLALVAAVVFWRAARRVGPPEEDYRETRSEAVDLVRSLAALYRQVTSDAEALALYHDALTRTVAHNSGLRGDALRKRVDELTGGTRSLEAINEAFKKSQSRRVSESQRESRGTSSSATLRL